tara:strand:- start:411 stop:650 length:240 start_codon:yes stop_codon:yes gene_type:complete
MGAHYVIVFVNDAKRTFNTTARKKSARLKQVVRQCRGLGYRKVVMADRLDKNTADAMKASIDTTYKAASYRYEARPPLP